MDASRSVPVGLSGALSFTSTEKSNRPVVMLGVATAGSYVVSGVRSLLSLRTTPSASASTAGATLDAAGTPQQRPMKSMYFC